MYLLGMFVVAAVPEGRRPRRPRLLPLPGDRLRPSAPTRRRADRRLHDGREPQERGGAKALLEYLGTGRGAGMLAIKARPASHRGEHGGRHRAATRRCRRRRPSSSSSADSIAQFLDRDTRPDFASTVMIPALQEFIKNPEDIDGLLQQHRDAEEDDLRLMTMTAVAEPIVDGAARRHATAAPNAQRHGARRRRPVGRRSSMAVVPIPAVLVIGLVWLPARARRRCLSFTSWDGIGGVSTHRVGRARRTTRTSSRSTRRSGRRSGTT